MKRCIVCGSIGDDDSTVCKVCGNPFVDLADESDKSTSMDEMERQLEQVWSKVQESAWSAGQADDGMPVIGDEQPDESDVTVQPDEPEVTVLPDLPDAEPVMPETVSGAAGIYSDSANTDSDQASQVIQEETRQPRPLPEAEGGLSAEEDMEPVQQEPQEQAQGEPSADKSGSSVQQEPQKQAQSKPSADKSGRSAQQKPQEQAQGKTSMDESDKSAQQKPQEQAQGEPSADKSGSSAQQKPQEQTPAGTVDVRSMDSARSEGENVESVRQQAQSQRQAVAERADQAQGRPGSASAGQAVSERQTMSRPRRRSGPQIYGQDSMTEYKGTQGVIRRDVHAGSAAAGRNPGYENGTRTQQMSTAERQSVASGTAGRGREGVGQSQEGRADRVINRENSVQGGSVDRRGTRMADQRTGQNIAVPPQRLNARQHGDMQPYAQVPQEDRQQEKGAFAARKILETSRGRLVSTLLLLIALFHTVYFAGAIAAVFMGELDYSLFGRLLGSLPLPAQLASYVSMFQSAMAQLDNGAIVIDLVLQVPDLLFFLGIWLLCITARTSKEQMSGAGFVFLRLAIILNMIAACVLLLVVLVLSVTLVIASGSAGNGRFPLAVAVLAAAIVVAMVIVMYYFCYLGTISAVSKNARLGESYGKTSSYVALVHMALAFTAIINVLSGILNGWIPVAVGGVGKFLWMLLFGIWIFNYRNAMSEYIE